MSETSPKKAPINAIVRFAVERRVTMGMAVLGIFVLGWLSLDRLPLEYLPSFSSSSITVRASYPSSSPEEIERLVVIPLEDSLGTINGIETMASSASADSGEVRLTFLDGTDMDLAAVDVRDRVDRVRHLMPDDLDRLTIRRFQSTDIPVVSFNLTAGWPKAQLYEFVETVVQRRLERLEGVAQVTISGVLSPQVQVILDRDRLEAHGVDVRQVASALRDDNLNLSAGDIRDGSRKLLVRAVGELATLQQIRDLPIGPAGVRLRDIAQITYDYPEQQNFNYLNGREAVTVRVNKTSTANLLAVVDRVKDELDVLQALPEAEGLDIHVYQDSSTDVREGIGQLRQAGLVGGAMAILAVYFFLRRLRTTVLVSIAIPVSVVFTFVLIYLLRQAGWLDMTLNVVSLTGLMLALGMLVDNSIVVIESIFRHRNEVGREPKEAALVGASEVALPITASTATTICVFLPVLFLGSGGGSFRRYFNDIGLTICIASAAALVVSLTVVPMVAAMLLSSGAAPKSRFFGRLSRVYEVALGFTMRHRAAFLVLAGVLLYGSWQLFNSIERTFGSRTVARQVTLQVDTPKQYSPEDTQALFSELYDLIDAQRDDLGIADIAHAYNRDTGRSRGGWRGTRKFDIYLVDESESDLSTTEVQNRIRTLLPTRPGVGLRIAQARGWGGNRSGVEVELMGSDPAVLELLAERVAGQLAQLPMIQDVDTSLESGTEEIRVFVDRERSMATGVTTQAVARTVNNALSSRALSYFRTEDRELDLVMQYAEDQRETLDQLKNVPVFSQAGPLPLAAVANFEYAAGPKSLTRENRQAKVSITANTSSPAATFGALRMVQGVVSQISLPPSYSWSFGRWTRFQQRDQGTSQFALLFAAILVYMLMAALFESYVQPLVIMASIPFAFLGVGVMMKLASQPRDNMTEIGLIILIGVVVNNAIVLIDHINRLRREGLSRGEAILLGGKHRLRPILMTAVTTILGLFPMVAPFFLPSVFGTLEGRAASWAPIGLIILGGLTTSTFLTLMIVPTIYSLFDDLTNFLRRVVRAA